MNLKNIQELKRELICLLMQNTFVSHCMYVNIYIHKRAYTFPFMYKKYAYTYKQFVKSCVYLHMYM